MVGVGSIYRHYMRWPTALDAAGIDLTERPPTQKNPGHRRGLSNAHILRVLSEAHDAVPGCLTVDRYKAWRAKQLEKHPERIGTLPAYETIWRRFGGWGRALAATGLGVQPGRTGRQPFSTDQLLQVVCEADAAVPGRLTVASYDSWREQEGIRDPARLRALPDHTTIIRRFGGWKIALKRERTENQ